MGARWAAPVLAATMLAAASLVHAEHLGPQDKNCSNFRTWQEAQAFFEAAGPGDPHHLDGDHNGIACESLPGGPRASATSTVVRTPTPSRTRTPSPASQGAGGSSTVTQPIAATATATPASAQQEFPASLPAADPPGLPPTPSAGEAGASPDNVGQTLAPTVLLPAPPPRTWAVVIEPAELHGDDGEVLWAVEPGDVFEVLIEEDGWALVVTGDESAPLQAWIALDSRVRLVGP